MSDKLQNESLIMHSRVYLPHYEAAEHAQMITYRLHDSLPQEVLSRFVEELESVSSYNREGERRRRIEEYLDKGAGSCSLLNESIAQVVEQNLLHFDGKRYIVHAWVIMPNHVHVLLTPGKDISLSAIVHSWKSYTAKRANTILSQQASFWQREMPHQNLLLVWLDLENQHIDQECVPFARRSLHPVLECTTSSFAMA